MNGRHLWWFAGFMAAAVAVGSCTNDFNKFTFEPEGTGGSVVGPTGGSGGVGGAVECDSPSQCGPNTDCANPLCTDGVCGVFYELFGTACDEDGGELCDGQGNCVPASCTDGLHNGNETDVDCGGPFCPACANGKDCMIPQDCLSKFCDSGTGGNGTAGSGGAAGGTGGAGGVAGSGGQTAGAGGVAGMAGAGGLGAGGVGGGSAGSGGSVGGTGGVGGSPVGGTGGVGGSPIGGTGGSGGSPLGGAGGIGGSGGAGGIGGVGTGGVGGSGGTGATGGSGGAGACSSGGGVPAPPQAGVCQPCATDADCAVLYCTFCDANGVCSERKDNGAPCVADNECKSGNCPPEDLVCCDTACDSTCLSCLAAKVGTGGTDGQCGNVQLGTDPDSECGTFFCDGAGDCQQADGAACQNADECDSGFCVDDVCCASLCDANCMACTAAKKGTGADGVCGPVEAGQDYDGDCAPNPEKCDGTGACKLDVGETCATGTDCALGHCPGANLVCCNSACDQTCESCLAADKGTGLDGTCGPVALNTDPYGQCTYECDGAGACQKALGASCLVADECESSECIDFFCCEGPCAGTCMACADAYTSQGDGNCRPVTNGTDPDTDCNPTTEACFDNAGTGECRLIDGEGCGVGTECVSTHCYDLVCCNAPCTGFCQACSLAKKGSGADGVCDFVDSGDDPDDECAPNCCDGTGNCDTSNGCP